ncbi:CCC motif membrane protein [Flavobacterium soli]|uniref:CCC motif membrane protein n=1 Tax=Flavobacterium soli TaxID=344881 RepID=UPI0003FBDAFA|nr:CCC motif membrane protein [Flavobacterium soli]
MEKRELPNATAVLVLGIISIVLSFCYGIFGIILGIIALVLSNKDLKLYNANPEIYNGIQNLRAGRICGIIGLSIGSLFFLILIAYLIFIGSILLPLAAGAAAA